MILSKKCARCKQMLPVEEFHRLTRSPDGLHYRCKECNREVNSKSKIKLKETRGAQKHKWVRNIEGKSFTPQHGRRAREYDEDALIDVTISLHKVYGDARGICALCGEFVLPKQASIDHPISLSKGGTHTWDNVQLAHLTCNQKKSNK